MHPCLGRTLAAFALALPLTVFAVDEWVTVSRDGSREIQIDRGSVILSDAGTKVGWARLVLSPQEAARAGYTSVMALNRYDCLNRSFTTIRRRYVDQSSVVVREDEVSDQAMRPVGRGGVDDRLWREICRPPSTGDLTSLADKAERLAAALQSLPTTPPSSAAVQPGPPPAPRVVTSSRPAAVSSTVAGPSRPAAPPTSPAPASRHPLAEWSYHETNGPPMWGKLRPEWGACANGRRQSPIDLQSGLVVNLEPVEFDYRPTYFRVVDTGRLLRIQTGEGLGARIRGERFELIYIELHRPGEARVDGVIHDLSVDLHHRAADGRLAVVSVQFRVGTSPNPVLDTWLSSLPLERGGQFAPESGVDLRPLLPTDPAHFLYVGSLTSPPCTEGVLRVVMKQAMDVSWEQLGIIAQLHPPSARPLQERFDRRVLESR